MILAWRSSNSGLINTVTRTSRGKMREKRGRVTCVYNYCFFRLSRGQPADYSFSTVFCLRRFTGQRFRTIPKPPLSAATRFIRCLSSLYTTHRPLISLLSAELWCRLEYFALRNSEFRNENVPASLKVWNAGLPRLTRAAFTLLTPLEL